jgi:hypothetical protein
MTRSLAALLFAALPAALPVHACAIPDEGNAPLHRMVSRVKYLPETEAWRASLPAGAIASYLVSLDAPFKISGRCYWPVEARTAGARWNLFYVSADGRRVLVARHAGRPVALSVWRTAGGR